MNNVPARSIARAEPKTAIIIPKREISKPLWQVFVVERKEKNPQNQSVALRFPNGKVYALFDDLPAAESFVAWLQKQKKPTMGVTKIVVDNESGKERPLRPEQCADLIVERKIP